MPPSEPGIAVTRGQMGRPRLSPEERERRRREREENRRAALARIDPSLDDLFALYEAGNKRLGDDDLERLCGITPAMVYAMREIAEGRVPKGAMATIEAFCKLAEIGHRPAKGKARNADPDAGKQVFIVINQPQEPKNINEPPVIDVKPPETIVEAEIAPAVLMLNEGTHGRDESMQPVQDSTSSQSVPAPLAD